MKWYDNYAWPFIYVSSFKCNQWRLWRDCLNVQARLVFPCSHCNKYLNHIKWYRQFCLTLHLRVFFLVQSVKALARLCKYAVSPDHLLFAYATSTKLCLHPFFAVRFAKALAILHICAVSPDHSLLAHGTSTKPPWTGPEILATAFNYIPSFLGICCSHMRHVPNFLVLAYKISLGLHLNPFFFRNSLLACVLSTELS